jgi:DNA-binding beta-propeller fold protein YncE
MTQVSDSLAGFVRVAGLCTTVAGSSPFRDSSVVIGGHIVGNTLAFQTAACRYSGAVQGVPPDRSARASGSVTCAGSEQGVTLNLHGTWQASYAGDLFPPSAAGKVAGQDGDTIAVPGDTVRFVVSATDARRVAWIGYRVGPPANLQDSLPATGKAFTGTLSATVRGAWVGAPSVVVFARDSVGNLGQASLGGLRVLALVRRPTRVVPLTTATAGGELVFDPKRNVLYLAETDSQRIAVISLESATALPSIPAPGKPVGLDLTLGGDSLVVALRRSGQLGFINLQLATPTMSTVALAFDTSTGRGPDKVRVLANNQAIVSLTFNGGGFGGNVLSYNLSSGAQRKRTDIGYNGGLVTENVPLTPTSDRARMFAMGGCCPGTIWVYTAATDTFTGPTRAGELPYRASFNAAGNRYLTYRQLYDGNLNLLATLNPPGSGFFSTVISPDGGVAYFQTDYGYLKVHLPDGAVLEQVRLLATGAVSVLPDGNTLVARTDQPGFSSPTNRLFIVDLRPMPLMSGRSTRQTAPGTER